LAGDSSPLPTCSAEIPFTNPIPAIYFKGREFVFAGQFVYGRTACVEITQLLGAKHADRVSDKTDFLVIGPLHSSHWQSGPIRVAVDAAAQTDQRIALGLQPTAIISEPVWLQAISDYRPSHGVPTVN
ncbi:MAG: hypothetical protein ABIQ93_12755, partial [Saprospiraceae bacterium]